MRNVKTIIRRRTELFYYFRKNLESRIFGETLALLLCKFVNYIFEQYKEMGDEKFGASTVRQWHNSTVPQFDSGIFSKKVLMAITGSGKCVKNYKSRFCARIILAVDQE